MAFQKRAGSTRVPFRAAITSGERGGEGLPTLPERHFFWKPSIDFDLGEIGNAICRQVGP
jgi:hypothetical protein